jgi:hypothetical protein
VIDFIILALLVVAALWLLLARYSPRPKVKVQSALPRMSAPAFRALVADLLVALGMHIDESDPSASDQRLVALQPGPVAEARHIVFALAQPPGDVVPASEVLELAEAVKAERAVDGMVVTPFAIDATGLGAVEAPLDLIDGARLRALVARHLPAKLSEIDRYAGFSAGSAMPPLSPSHLPV